FGTDRVSGGAFERAYLLLLAFGADGRLTRTESFDADRDAEALARFDELTAEPSRAVTTRARRVRANFAPAYSARLDAAMAAGDTSALESLFLDDASYVDHVNGIVFDRQGIVLSLRNRLSGRDVTYRHEPLASMGDFLALL